MSITAVTISKNKESFPIDIPFYCNTRNWKPIYHKNNGSPDRVNYLTDRYSCSVNEAIDFYPQTEHVMIIDSYYLHQNNVRNLISRYYYLNAMQLNVILGASIWVREKNRVQPSIIYYETLSVKEYRNKHWIFEWSLPSGLQSVSAVGGCWIFPRFLWDGKFNVVDGGLVNSPCIRNGNCKILLDCDVRLWRSKQDGAILNEYSPIKRLRVSAGELLNGVKHLCR